VRLLFVTHYFHPEVGAAPTRILELAQELSSNGHEVTVLTGFPNYPDGVIPTSYRGRRFQLERLGDLRVVRTAVYPAPNQGVARRLLNHTSFALSAVASSRRTGQVDVVIVETPPLFTAAAGVAVARLKRAPLLLNVADLWPDAAIEFGALRNRAAVAGAREIERFAYRHADVIAVPTPGLKRVLHERGRPAEQIVLVPHGVDPARFPRAADSQPVRRRVVYCGTIGMGHAVGTLIEAARRLEEAGKKHELLIVGDGAERAELEARARRLGLAEVRFAGRMPRGQLPDLLATAEVTVATQRNLPLLADALSTKVLEYMAAARPVVAAATGWTAEVVAEAKAGVVCPPEQPAALAEAIAGLTADPRRARTLGLNGRRYVETNLTRHVAVERIELALHSMVGA
jgi:colanic acid biosynthesis glycosyl transferase WcaI